MNKKLHDKELFAKAVSHSICEISQEKDSSEILFTKRAMINQFKDNVVVKNSLKYLIHNLKKTNTHRQLNDNKNQLFLLFLDNKRKVHKHIKHKTTTNKKIYVHGINTLLSYSLDKLKKNKNIEVIAPKLTPIYENWQYLGEGIKYVEDLDMYYAIKESNMILIGADKISKNHTICKKGTNMCIEIANKFHKPTYVCASSFYLDAHNAIKDKEFEKHYEKIKNKSISGIISELGIHQSHHFYYEALHYNSWLKNKDL
ncbi:hypothetical protein HOD20_01950 [archaeon]|nr:hypothetical protein [archaeon]MBT4351269.1 hypothetical protein [archaeon]